MGSSRATRAVAASSWPGKTVCSRRNLVAPKRPVAPTKPGSVIILPKPWPARMPTSAALF